MIDDYDRMTAERPRRGWIMPLILVLVAFAGGLFAMGYALTHWDVAQRYIGAAPATPQVEPAALAAAAPAARPVIVEQVSAADDARLAVIERRLDEISERASAASGNADRAEGLLVAFAARRALDRGAQLGYIEGLLRERFGGTQPQAVAVILSAARQPVTLATLTNGLEEAAPSLTQRNDEAGWWESLRREAAALVVVRRADMPSAAPADRLARARIALESGNVDSALAEISRLPMREAAARWIPDARRYVQARNALDTIETAALLMPREGPAD